MSPTEAAAPDQKYDQFMVDIVDYFYHKEITSDYAYKRARLALLDALGCAIETLTLSPECRSFVGPVVADMTVPNGCHLPGTDFVLDPVKAAFDLGAMIRYLDHNDGYIGREWGHPSDMIGAILSVSEWTTRQWQASKAAAEGGQASESTTPQPRPITMNQLLTAIIKAYEVHCLFQHLNSFNKVGLDHTILVKVGAVSAVSWLLGLSERQALSALSHVYQDGGMLRTYRQGTNTGPRKGWAAGDACMRAVHLALLARAGQPGAPTVLTDPKWGFYTTLMGGKSFELPAPYDSYAIENSGFKLVAAEGHGISACNASVIASEQLKARGISEPAEAIKRIDIRTMKPAITIINKQGPLYNYADRDHCLSYMVAVSILKGAVPRVDDYADASPFAKDPRVEAIRDTVVAVEDPQLTADYFDQSKRTLAAGLTVTLKDGTVLPEALVEAPLGHAKHEGTNDAVLVKFRENMELMFDAEVAEKAIALTSDDRALVPDFVALFWKGSANRRPGSAVAPVSRI